MDELRQSRNKAIIIIVFVELRGDRCPRFSSGTSTNTFSAPIKEEVGQNSNFVYKIVSIQPLLTFPSIAMYGLSWLYLTESDSWRWCCEMSRRNGNVILLFLRTTRDYMVFCKARGFYAEQLKTNEPFSLWSKVGECVADKQNDPAGPAAHNFYLLAFN